MDYNKYRQNLDESYSLDCTSFSKNASRNEVISRLKEIALRKRQLLWENNSIIEEYIVPYEINLSLLTPEKALDLERFYLTLKQDYDYFDRPVSLRLGKILLAYYRKMENWGKMVRYLYFCTYLQQIADEHTNGHDPVVYAGYTELMLEKYHCMDENGKILCVAYLLFTAFDRSRLNSGIHRFMRAKSFMLENNIDFSPANEKIFVAYYGSLSDSLAITVEAFQTMENPFTESDINLIEQLVYELEGLLENPAANVNVFFALAYIAQLKFYIGKSTYEEMIKSLLAIQDKNPYLINSYLINNIWLYSPASEDEKKKQCLEIIESVMTNFSKPELKRDNFINMISVMQFISEASKRLGFDILREYVLDLTVYSDKALYIHTVMVSKISLVLMDSIMDECPEFFSGVTGLGFNEIEDKKDYLRNLMNDCALFHDIGKHFCIDYVSNSNRSLSEDEISIVRQHPENYLHFFTDNSTEEICCVRDCALLHHVWYNEKDGYPERKHTKNKAMVSILSVADGLDAGTDVLGRPYNQIKSYDEVVAGMDMERDTRYCALVIDQLKKKDVKEKILNILQEERCQLTWEVYTGRKLQTGI